MIPHNIKVSNSPSFSPRYRDEFLTPEAIFIGYLPLISQSISSRTKCLLLLTSNTVVNRREKYFYYAHPYFFLNKRARYIRACAVARARVTSRLQPDRRRIKSRIFRIVRGGTRFDDKNPINHYF